MHLFYAPHIGQDGSCLLPDDEAAHCVRVLRMKDGDPIQATDGNGNLFEGVITCATLKRCEFSILKITENHGKRNYTIHIAIAPTKNLERIEWFLEKTTEMGIDAITPLLCQHSERKIVKEERLEKVIVSAMKQSQHTFRPKLNPLTPFPDFISTAQAPLKTIAVCEGDRQTLSALDLKPQETIVLIGPEGDFSPSEIQLAVQSGFIPITLGNSRLRTETAGVVACNTIHFLHTL